ncbi:MAG TPA: efflux transporter outer membrane subunit [Thermoanaerobaculia bacterium]|nr:efflux transporter outer membrane subunit [Thermoanaerobaculia bacterium]
MLVRPLAAAVAALSITACASVGPDYRRPGIAVPDAYSAGAAAGEIPDAWWTLFGDAELDRLVGEALAANQDIALAAARVDEARALAGVARADRFPQVSAGASGSRTKLSQDTATVPPGFELERDAVRATGTLSFELDFWGRLRRAHEAARAELLATEEGRRNVRLAVVSEVATAWFDRLALDRQLAIARETLVTRNESVRLQRLRFDAGSISELDLSQAEAELAATEATVPQLERTVRQTENRLAVLLGRVGGEIPRAGSLVELKVPEIPAGLPSELLARRPDVVGAEQRLVAANARIGVARAALFPSITLTGYAGSESQQLADLFASGTSVWQAALGLVQPIFNAGKLRRQVDAAEARERQALASYAKTVETAFAEVEDALVARSTGAEERAALARQVAALARARRLAVLRYEAGDASYLEVLDAERNLFRADLELVRAQRGEAGAAVALFRALGGGWPLAAAPDTASPETAPAGASR